MSWIDYNFTQKIIVESELGKHGGLNGQEILYFIFLLLLEPYITWLVNKFSHLVI